MTHGSSENPALLDRGAFCSPAQLSSIPVAAQQVVGTATAVNPSSESTPPGGSTQTLTIGARVLHKEHIHTSPSGGVQLLFLDKSSLSIAPNTSIVIDEFVYDPDSGKGHMLTTLTEGALALCRRRTEPSGRGDDQDSQREQSAFAAGQPLSTRAQAARRPSTTSARSRFQMAAALSLSTCRAMK